MNNIRKTFKFSVGKGRHMAQGQLDVLKACFRDRRNQTHAHRVGVRRLKEVGTYSEF